METLNVVHKQVNVKLRLPTLMNKILQAAPVSASDFVAHWRAIAGPPTKLQEVVSTGTFMVGSQLHLQDHQSSLSNNLSIFACGSFLAFLCYL
jgi:hypothetical protein